MITDCSDLREVSDFHFLQLKTLKLAKGNERVPEKALNIVAAASKFGLLFVGIEKGFKVLKLQDVLDLDEDKESKGIEENYLCTIIQSETPVTLALNSTQTTLATCVQYGASVVLNLYDVSAFVNLGSSWKPFFTTPLSPQGSELRDFAWNPAAEGLFAYCLNDGSLHIEELSGPSSKLIASVQTANAFSVCWSPKGKQLVVGKNGGQFTQYKPNLQEVKTVEPPALEESPIYVSSIYWISNTSFAVVYVAGDAPNLFIVSTPKDSPVTYVNFYDVCLGNNSSPSQKYFMHLEPQWGILICASIDSIEIAVLGDMPNWVQWDLKEDGKALLPGKDGATHAIGMAVIYSAQKRIIISESEAYPPMPIIFFLTNNGLLIPFHMINAKPDAVSMVSPPLVLESKKEIENERMTLKRSSAAVSQLTQSSAVTVASNLPVPNQFAPQTNVSQTVGMNLTFGVAPNSSFCPAEKKDSSTLNKTKTVNKLGVATTAPAYERNEQGFSSVNKENDMLANRDSSYMEAVISEIQSFTKELQDLKELASHTSGVDGEMDMATLKTFALNLHNFQKDIAETMQSLNNDIFVLKNILLESFVMVEEAYSRDRRRNDHSYITMLKERALDPVTAKRLQKMNQHYQYLSTQLQEVSDKLDQDCIHLLSNKRESLKGMSNISSAEAIYKTIVNNQKIIHNLRKKVESLLRKTEEKKLRNISKSGKWGSYHKRCTQEDLSKLADEFLQVKVTHQEEREPPVAKKLSSESQNFLKSFLKESNVVTVRPTAVYSPSQSRLLSNTITFEETSAKDQKEKENISAPEQIVPASPKDNIKPQIQNVISKSSLPLENSKTEFIAQPCTPVYEAITPPGSNSATEHKTRTYSPETESRPKVIYHPIPTQASAPSPTSEEISLSFSVLKNNCDASSKTLSNEESPLVSKNASVQVISPAPSSVTTSSKAADHFSLSDISKSVECMSKPTASNSFITLSSPLSSFQFSNSLGQKTESGGTSFAFNSKLVTIQPVATSTVVPVSSEIKNQYTPGPLVFGQQDKSLPKPGIFNTPAAQNTNFTLPLVKTPIGIPVPVAEVETKASSSSDKLFSAASETKIPSFGLKLPSSTELAEKSATLKDEISSSTSGPSFASGVALPNMNLNEVDKTLIIASSTDSVSQAFSTSDESKPNVIIIQSASGNTSLDQLTITPIKSHENNVTSSNQAGAVDILPNLPILKQSVTSLASDVLPPKSSVVSPIQSAVVVNTPVVSSASFTNSFTAPVVSSTVTIVSQPSSLTSVPSSTPLSTFALTTSSGSNTFGANAVSTPPVCSSDTSTTSTTKTDVVTPAFGLKSAATFEQTTTEAPSFFGNTTTETSVFGQTTVPPNVSFGQPVTSSSFPSASGGFFSQTPSFGTNATTSSADLNNQTSAFSFGKSTFGQQNSGSFGLAKSLFGQNTAPVTQSNSASSFSFNQSSGSMFGQGLFFSGLGGKPSEENANKNVFAMANSAKSSSETNLFGNQGAFGAKNSSFSGGGSFSSGSGSVAQSGFGAFQQSTPQKPTAFGSAPSFGGAPSFGSPPAFGAPPTFGTGNSLTASVFGQQQMPNFSNIANSSSPTFGSLASQNTSGFGSSPPLGSGFGSSSFGNSSFGNTSFGGFGNPGSPPSNSSAFTQWRN